MTDAIADTIPTRGHAPAPTLSVKTFLAKSDRSDTRILTPKKPQELEQTRKQITKLDISMSRDFLNCDREQGSRQFNLEELTEAIQASDTVLDYDFVNSTDVINTANALRSTSRTVPHESWSLARARSNPFERIGKCVFMNRGATKLAALDAAFGLTVTKDDKASLRALRYYY